MEGVFRRMKGVFGRVQAYEGRVQSCSPLAIRLNTSFIRLNTPFIRLSYASHTPEHVLHTPAKSRQISSRDTFSSAIFPLPYNNMTRLRGRRPRGVSTRKPITDTEKDPQPPPPNDASTKQEVADAAVIPDPARSDSSGEFEVGNPSLPSTSSHVAAHARPSPERELPDLHRPHRRHRQESPSPSRHRSLSPVTPSPPPPPPPPPPLRRTEEEEVSDSGSVASSVVQPKLKRAASREKYNFTDEQEVELAEFYGDNELFYNKRLKSYKDSEKKKRLLEEKGASLSPPCTGEHSIIS